MGPCRCHLRFHQVATHLGHCYAPLNHFAEPPYLLHHSTACGCLEPPLGSPTSCRAASFAFTGPRHPPLLPAGSAKPSLACQDHWDRHPFTDRTSIAVVTVVFHTPVTTILLRPSPPFSLSFRGTAFFTPALWCQHHRRGLWVVSSRHGLGRWAIGALWSIASMHLVHGRRATHVPLTHGARLWWTRSTPIPR